jgi:dolichol-phosphate mannosyltransferase
MGLFKDPYIVIPTFNEAENLPELVSALFLLPVPGLRILVVDDNSPDGTGEIAEELSRRYPNRVKAIHRAGKLGIGSAYITGFRSALQADADSIVQMDADFSHPPEMVMSLLDALDSADAALGSRYVPGGKLDEHWSIWRTGLSTFGNIYAKTILRLPVHDATGGFRAWRRDTLLGMPLERIRSNGYAFQIEMVFVAYRQGNSFVEVPFYFADRHKGSSKMSFSIQFEAARRVWQMLYEYRDLEITHQSKQDTLSL